MPSVFSSGLQSALYLLIIRLIVALIALPIHECAHGYAAYRMGDYTAKRQGRLTLNPLAHFDPIGTVAIILFGFGWAKPVPINPLNFDNPKRGMMLSSLAGPLSNIGLAFISMVLYKLSYIPSGMGISGAFLSTVQTFLLYMISINITLGVFNLIPIPPLDGSRIATFFLPQRIYFKIMQYENIIFIGLMVALWFGILDGPISFVSNTVTGILDFATRPIDWLTALFMIRF
ncbi:MAG: site-2 protease family protein [Oscillospiraceae bacterium]|nr:site-2 protease family protein [Oscillospiraceae bacterium]